MIGIRAGRKAPHPGVPQSHEGALHHGFGDGSILNRRRKHLPLEFDHPVPHPRLFLGGQQPAQDSQVLDRIIPQQRPKGFRATNWVTPLGEGAGSFKVHHRGLRQPESFPDVSAHGLGSESSESFQDLRGESPGCCHPPQLFHRCEELFRSPGTLHLSNHVADAVNGELALLWRGLAEQGHHQVPQITLGPVGNQFV